MHRATPTAYPPAGLEAAKAPWGPGWTPSGVIEVLEPLTLPRRVARIQSVLSARIRAVTVVIDAPHDPHNGAAIIRSCEAFGIQSVHVVERIEPFLVSRAVTQGTERWVDVIRHKNASEVLGDLDAADYAVVVAHPEGDLLPEDLARVERLALIMGNEKDGVCDEIARAARHTVRVPMRGFVESLNVSVTTALLLAAAVRDRPGDLTDREQRLLLARALVNTVPRSDRVLANLEPR